LPDGRVLVVGGWYVASTGTSVQYPGSAEIYDPATGTFALTGTSGPLNIARHTATALLNGTVLIAGGETGSNSIVIYDPVTDDFLATGGMDEARGQHTATLLNDGKVLVIGGKFGGYYLSSAEIYDPVTGSWSRVANLSTGRANHASSVLPSGDVLVTGGGNSSNGAAPSVSTVEIYDVDLDAFITLVASTQRQSHTSTVLPDGSVVIVGGHNKNTGGSFTLSSATRYFP